MLGKATRIGKTLDLEQGGALDELVIGHGDVAQIIVEVLHREYVEGNLTPDVRKVAVREWLLSLGVQILEKVAIGAVGIAQCDREITGGLQGDGLDT